MVNTVSRSSPGGPIPDSQRKAAAAVWRTTAAHAPAGRYQELATNFSELLIESRIAGSLNHARLLELQAVVFPARPASSPQDAPVLQDLLHIAARLYDDIRVADPQRISHSASALVSKLQQMTAGHRNSSARALALLRLIEERSRISASSKP